MLDYLKDSPSLNALKSISIPFSLLLENLWDGSKAAFISFLQKETKKNILLITNGVEESRLFEEFSSILDISVLEFPSWETLPGENIPPSPDIIGRRMEVLDYLTKQDKNILLLTPLQALLQKTIDKTILPSLIHTWEVNKTKIDFSNLKSFLNFLGYKQTSVVSDKGDFAIRGGILDIFVTSQMDPYRIEFFGDEIDNIRIFDPVGQKSIKKIDKAFICPAREQDILKREKKHSLLLDYISQDTIIIFDDLLSIEDSYASIKKMPGSNSPYFLSIDTLFDKIKDLSKVYITNQNIEELSDIKKRVVYKVF